MTEVSDYQKQMAKLQRFNRRVQWATAGVIILLFVACIAYAVWSTSQTRNQTTQILDRISNTQKVSSKEAQITRQGGDIIRCILNIPATTRTQDQINACYPGGSQEAWLQYRKEALGE